jgi:hypothetical protein
LSSSSPAAMASIITTASASPTVNRQPFKRGKSSRGDKSGPPVAVDERVVLGNPQGADRRQLGDVRCAVAGPVQRTCKDAVEKAGVEKAGVTEAGGAPMFRQLLVVDGEDEFLR